jgi:hypothetical protein
MLAEKDSATIALYKELYDIEIGTDLSCFDIILDISALVSNPTLEEAQHSISVVHEIIRPAAGWYLTRKMRFLDEFNEATTKHAEIVKRNRLIDLKSAEPMENIYG